MFKLDPGKDLIAGLEETAQTLLSEFGSIDDERAGASPEFDAWSAREGEDWSVKQLIAHVSEIERDLVTEALGLAADPESEIGKPPGTLWGGAQTVANARPIAEIIDEFGEVHAWTLEQLATLEDEDLETPGTHLGTGATTVLAALSVVLGHRRMHIFQAQSNLVSLAAHERGSSVDGQYTVHGAGDVSVLLVDAATSRWDPVVGALAASGLRVIQHHYSVTSADVERVRSELDVGALVVGGTGSGSVDASKYAVVHPENIAGLIVANLPILPFYRDRPDDFRPLTKPVLALVGANHPQAALVRERAEEFIEPQVVMVDDAARDLPGEQPEAIIEPIVSFVQDVTPA